MNLLALSCLKSHIFTMRSPFPKFAYLVIVACTLASVGGMFYLEKLELKDFGTGLLALLGTLSGATLAFRLNEDKESKKEVSAQISALNRALFVLIRQINATSLIQRELKPFKTPFDRAFNFPAVTVAPYEDLVHRFENLEFLLNTTDSDMLMRLTVEQECFHQMLASLKTRNEFYVRELGPEIERLKLNGKTISEAEARALLGERMFGTAMNNTQILWNHVESTEKSIEQIHEELGVTAKCLYPDSKFVKFVK